MFQFVMYEVESMEFIMVVKTNIDNKSILTWLFHDMES